MASAKRIERPMGNPFLYEKIKYRMQERGGPAYTFGKTKAIGWALAAVLLLALNGISIMNKIGREKHILHTEAYNAIAPEMQTQTIYNY